jgi:hypothetical protein
MIYKHALEMQRGFLPEKLGSEYRLHGGPFNGGPAQGIPISLARFRVLGLIGLDIGKKK